MAAMNPAHLHLAVCHLPVIGLAFSMLVNIYALITKSKSTLRLSMILYVISGACVALAFATGDGAEKLLESSAGIGEDLIEPHEEMAMFFFIGLMLIAGAGIAALLTSWKDAGKLWKFNLFILIAAALISISAIRTAEKGGEIRHREIMLRE